jgi:uncharacterized protein YbdZ (MbtH family)
MVEHEEKREFYLLINHLKQGFWPFKVDVTAYWIVSMIYF